MFPRRIMLVGLFVSGVGRAQMGGAQTGAGGDPAVVRALAGCYHVTLGSWSRKSRLGPEASTTLVHLDTVALYPGQPRPSVARRLAPADWLPERGLPSLGPRPGQWRLHGADSIVITPWRTATESESFYGHRVPGGFRGVMRLTSDGIPVDRKTGRILWSSWPWARATVTRIACP